MTTRGLRRDRTNSVRGSETKECTPKPHSTVATYRLSDFSSWIRLHACESTTQVYNSECHQHPSLGNSIIWLQAIIMQVEWFTSQCTFAM